MKVFIQKIFTLELFKLIFMNNTNEPKPIEITEDGTKKLYIIEDYKIWAENYAQALELLVMIKGF